MGRFLIPAAVYACLTLGVACYPVPSSNLPELAFAALKNDNRASDCARSYRSAILNTPGLIGYWPLDESSGGTGVNASGGGPDFTFVSGVTQNVAGFAVDGTSRAIATSSAANQITSPAVATTQTDNVSLEIWVNWDGVAGSGVTVFYNGDTGSAGYGIYLSGGTGNLSVLMGGQGSVDTTYAPPVNQWAHLAIVRDNGTWRIFANGQELSTSGVFNPNPVSGSLLLGANSTPAEFFGGSLDEPAIYTVALSPAQISSHVSAGCR